MKIKEFKIRASGSGKIVGLPKTKKDKELGLLSGTAKSYCDIWLKEQIYSRRNEFSSKYTEKGLITEDNSIDFMADFLELGFLIKNESYFENDFLTGTPDVLPKGMDLIIDVKNSWDCFTFPLFEKDIPNKDYYWQAQCYMALANKNTYKLVYILSDTPEHLIEKEAYWWCMNNGYSELDLDIYNKFLKKMTYDNIPKKHKVKVFDIKRNQEDIDFLYGQVEKCRSYISEELKKLNIQIK